MNCKGLILEGSGRGGDGERRRGGWRKGGGKQQEKEEKYITGEEERETQTDNREEALWSSRGGNATDRQPDWTTVRDGFFMIVYVVFCSVNEEPHPQQGFLLDAVAVVSPACFFPRPESIPLQPHKSSDKSTEKKETPSTVIFSPRNLMFSPSFFFLFFFRGP